MTATIDRPLTLRCGLMLPNRVAMAPLTNLQSHEDGTLGDAEHAWLLARAEGGFGLVSTCAAYVSAEGKAWSGQLGIASDAHLPGLTRLAGDLAAAGTRSVVQLHHAGSKATLAPRKLSTADDDGVSGATEADLARVTADFVAAALRAERAGFHGVEVHGANGYLFTRFLAPGTNPRTDAWGGALENRARLLRQVVRAVRAAVRADFAVGVRISPVDQREDRGLVLDDSLQVGRWLAEDGADFVHLSLRDATRTPPFEPDAPVVAEAFRAALPSSVALFVVGGIWDRDGAARACAAGADVVVLGRASIAHPDWPRASAAPDFQPAPLPWAPEMLRERCVVSPALLAYLLRFPGMVEGGAPPNG